MIGLRRINMPIVWLVLAAALLVRAAIPMGWMPVVQAGGIRIALCTSAGPAFATLGSDGRLHRDTLPEAPRDPCPFGLALAQAADLPSPLTLSPAPLMPALLASPTPVAAAYIQQRLTRPPARGPPAFA